MAKPPSGMELMASNLLRALGIDPEKLTLEFTTRIEQFEQGLAALNLSLKQINERMDAIERTQAQILSILQQGKAASGELQSKPNGAAEQHASNTGAQP